MRRQRQYRPAVAAHNWTSVDYRRVDAVSIKLEGPWKKGYAYDLHTMDSVYLGVDTDGHDRWKNKRSQMGELVYRLKYRGDRSVVSKIVKLLGKYKGLETMDYIVPIPPSNPRERQPVTTIALALGKLVGVEVLTKLLAKSPGSTPLKDVDAHDERRKLLRKSMTLNEEIDVSRKSILLVDDLYRSGATLEVATNLLYKKGKVKGVYVLTMTKTRSRR
jgi:predicted amidophosphoribosyltransferase